MKISIIDETSFHEIGDLSDRKDNLIDKLKQNFISGVTEKESKKTFDLYLRSPLFNSVAIIDHLNVRRWK